MLRWFICAASRASPRNASTNSLLSVRWERIFFTTSIFWKPAGPCCLARNTSPIPPAARFFMRKYFQKQVPTSHDAAASGRTEILGAESDEGSGAFAHGSRTAGIAERTEQVAWERTRR